VFANSQMAPVLRTKLVIRRTLRPQIPPLHSPTLQPAMSAHMIRPLILSATLLALVGCKSREEKLAAEESKGNFVVSAQSRLLKGMGEALKTEGTEAAGSLSEGTGQVVKAVGGGFEKSLGQVKLSVNEGLQAAGVAAT